MSQVERGLREIKKNPALLMTKYADLISDDAFYPVHKVSRHQFAESVIGQVAVFCRVVIGR